MGGRGSEGKETDEHQVVGQQAEVVAAVPQLRALGGVQARSQLQPGYRELVWDGVPVDPRGVRRSRRVHTMEASLVSTFTIRMLLSTAARQRYLLAWAGVPPSEREPYEEGKWLSE